MTSNSFDLTSSENQAANNTFKPIVIDKLTDLISIKSDNQGSISLAFNLVFYTQTKHIEIQ